MLIETEPPAKVWLYRAIVFLQNIPICFLGRPDALGFDGALEGAFGRRRTASLRSGSHSMSATMAPQRSAMLEHACSRRLREKGLQESLRLGGEIVRARVARLSTVDDRSSSSCHRR